MEVGYWLASEEYGPKDLLRQAQAAGGHGLTRFAISDHYHPWTESQGHSPFVWSVIAAVAATVPDAHVTTFVTCPTIRIHPAVVAQAAATSSLLLDGRFTFGLGSGENLNEHILGDPWPPADIRLEMLEESVELMRELWKGAAVTWRGRYYKTDNARIYTRPDEPPPVYVSAFGEKALALAARIGDGFITTAPKKEHVEAYEQQGGRGPKAGGLKVVWGPDERAARELSHEIWPNAGVPGELSQELPMPGHFEQASSNVTVEEATASGAYGPDPAQHIAAIQEYVDAGFDEVYVSQVGKDQRGFLDFYAREVLPHFRG